MAASDAVAGGVATSQAADPFDEDDLLQSSGKGRRKLGIRKKRRHYAAVRSQGEINSRFGMLAELKDQTAAVMESVVFSVLLCFNLVCLLLGIICWDEGLGTLWIELDGKYEFEYDFGWHKSVVVHESHGISFDHKEMYEKDLEAAGEFFVLIVSVGAMMIFSLLIVKLLDWACECCARQRRAYEERSLTDEAESWDAFLFIMSVWYAIFQLIYLISILAFNGEFSHSCSDYMADLEREITDTNAGYKITQYECVEGWGMYFQYFNLILGFVNIILLCQIRKSINLGNEIRKAQGPPEPEELL